MNKATPTWTNRAALLQQLQKTWDRGVLLLQSIDQSGFFPKRLVFKTPTSRALSDEFGAVRQWAEQVQKISGFRIVYKTVRHRVVGQQNLAAEAWIDCLDDAIALLGKQPQINAFKNLVELTRQRAPTLLGWVTDHPHKALALADQWPRLLDFIQWRQANPHPQIYLRQVSIPNLDSKFIEQHRADLIPLLDICLPVEQINSEQSGVKQFERRYGFLSRPIRVRLRLLDPKLELIGPPADHAQHRDNDITLSASDFTALELQTTFISQLDRVFITENEINFLAFPAHPASLVIFGSGYGFDALAQASWLASKQIIYWGDIDSHGFAILDQLRSKFPQVTSLLMDTATLTDHRQFWGQETKPESRPLPRLSANEQTTYQALINNRLGDKLRLEQERLPFAYLTDALQQLNNPDK